VKTAKQIYIITKRLGKEIDENVHF